MPSSVFESAGTELLLLQANLMLSPFTHLSLPFKNCVLAAERKQQSQPNKTHEEQLGLPCATPGTYSYSGKTKSLANFWMSLPTTELVSFLPHSAPFAEDSACDYQSTP